MSELSNVFMGGPSALCGVVKTPFCSLGAARHLYPFCPAAITSMLAHRAVSLPDVPVRRQVHGYGLVGAAGVFIDLLMHEKILRQNRPSMKGNSHVIA
jgi:hypothetical protein